MRRICVFSLACMLSAAGCQAAAVHPQQRVGRLAAARLTTTRALALPESRRLVLARPAIHFRQAALRRAVARYLAGRPGRAGLYVHDLGTGRTFRYGRPDRFVTASIVKVDILAGLLLLRQAAHRELTAAERALATRMITVSDNDAANVLYDKIGGGPGLARINRRFGLRCTTPYPRAWGVSRTCPEDQVRLLRALATARSPLSAPHRRYVLRLMASVAPDQSWGISAATEAGDRFAVKNGWVPLYHHGSGWTVNSIGRIRGGHHDFLIAVLSAHQPNLDTGIQTIEALARLVIASLRTP